MKNYIMNLAAKGRGKMSRKIAFNFALLLMAVAFASCVKCDEKDPNSDCYVPPATKKHTTTYLFDVKSFFIDFNFDWARARASADSNEVEKVIFVSNEDWAGMGPRSDLVVKTLREEFFSYSPKFAGSKIFNPPEITAEDSTQMAGWGFDVRPGYPNTK